MEITKQYKDSEIGKLPVDWEVEELGQLLKVRHGRDQKKVRSTDGKYPILGTGGILGYANEFLYDSESVLIGRKGTIDRPQYMDSPFWTVDTLFYTEINKNCDPKFLFYKFHLIDWYSYNEASGVPSLNAHTIEKIQVSLPPLPEQKAIAKVLSDTDNLIQSLEKQIAKKRLIKQGAMQKLLSPKEGWEKKKLGEIFTVTRGYVLSMKEIKTTEDSQYKYPVFSSQTKNNGLMGYYKDYLYKDSITWTTDGANAGDVRFRKGRFYCTNVCGVLMSNNGYANTCVAEAFNRVSKKYVSYVGNPKLMNNVVRDIELAIPKEIEEQQYISKVIEDMEEEILVLEKRLLKLIALKKGLMQNLLTGKIRLKLS